MPSPEMELHSELPLRLPSPSLVGQQVGHFRIERELGRGAMGTVYLGRHEIIGSKVAIKVIHPEVAQNSELVRRFHAEARAVNLIGHPGIVSIFDLDVLPPDRPYLLMEFLEGNSLASRLGSPFDPGLLAEVLAQVLCALEAAHAHGVLHRDLKPDNIFLVDRPKERTPSVKLLDFGVAKLLEPSESTRDSPEQTGSGLVMGTPAFMAPEQWVNGELDGRADLYGLGITAWRALVGRLPFRGKGLTDMLLAHRAHAVAAPHELNPAVPEALSRIVMRAMARRPEDRFQSAAQMREALLPLLDPSGPRARLLDGAGAEIGLVAYSELTRNGAFLYTNPPYPALSSQLSLELPCPSGPLRVTAQVVRQVTFAEARQWKMPPGIGVQFVGLDEAARRKLSEWSLGPAAEFLSAAAAEGDSSAAGRPGARVGVGNGNGSAKPPPLPRPAMKPPPLPSATAVVGPPSSVRSGSAGGEPPEWAQRLQHLLEAYADRGTHYEWLRVPRNADFERIRAAAGLAQRELGAVGAAGALPEPQATQLAGAVRRLEEAAAALLDPRQRALYDAELGNYQGVARCVRAGLSPDELKTLRARWLEAKPRELDAMEVELRTADQLLKRGRLESACRHYVRALKQDPLNPILYGRLQKTLVAWKGM